MKKQRNDCRLIWLCAVLCVISAHAGRSEIIGMWLFDEGAGKEVKDTSGHKHTGALIDGA